MSQLREKARVDEVRVLAPPEWAERFDITEGQLPSYYAKLKAFLTALRNGQEALLYFVRPKVLDYERGLVGDELCLASIFASKGV